MSYKKNELVQQAKQTFLIIKHYILFLM